jgi:hypothetical protein
MTRDNAKRKARGGRLVSSISSRGGCSRASLSRHAQLKHTARRIGVPIPVVSPRLSMVRQVHRWVAYTAAAVALRWSPSLYTMASVLATDGFALPPNVSPARCSARMVGTDTVR